MVLLQLSSRGHMVKVSGAMLGRAVTIAIRYSCVRKQGFVEPEKANSYKSEERAIIDHQVGTTSSLNIGI